MTLARRWRAFAAQTRIELLLATRRPENLFVTLAVPLLLLVFFASVPLIPETGGARRIDRLVPGVLTVAVMSTGLVALGISTAFERGYGVLKRLSTTPLPLGALLGARASTVLVTMVLQLLLVAVVGSLLGWVPAGGVVAAVARALPWLLLGTATFAALGLLLAGVLRPEAVLAAANGLFLLAILLGGAIVPPEALPGPVALVAAAFPPSLLAALLRDAFDGAALAPLPALGLLAWAVVAAVLTVRTFRVD